MFHRLRVTGINAKTTGTTLIGTTSVDGRVFVPMWVVVHSSAASTITIPCTLCIGTNSATYNNILAATAMTSLLVVNNLLASTLSLLTTSNVAANTGVFCNITIAATGTSQTLDVDVIGYYI